MSKKWVRNIVFILAIVLITGCNITSPVKQLSLVVHVAADSTEKYKAYGFFYDYEKDQSLNDSLVITVEGSTITGRNKANEELIPGVTSPVTIIASHSRIGTVQRDIRIPEGITDLEVDPETPIKDWVDMKKENLTLRWTTIETGSEEKHADFYVVYVKAYNGTTELGTNLATSNRQWTGVSGEVTATPVPGDPPVPSPTPVKKQVTSITIDRANRDVLLNFSGISRDTISHYTIQVQGYKIVTLSEVSSDSTFEVGGPWSNPVPSE